MRPVDLEDLADGYQHRPSSAEALERARRAGQAAGLDAGDLALDLGGGRGEHAAIWCESRVRSVVVDASRSMVRFASSQPGVEAICASTQNLPLVDDSARLAYFHLSLHYGDWRGSLDEVARVLRPGGECWIWTMGEQHHRASFLAKWFPSVGDIDAARFPDPPEVTAYLESISGRVDAGIDVETKSMAAIRWRRAVVARFVSTLQLIPAEEFSQGLADFDAAYPDPDQMVDYVLTFDWIRSRF